MAAAAGYWELALPAPPEAAEALTNFLWEQGALGVVEEQVGDGAARLRAFFHAEGPAEPLAERVGAYAGALRALGLGEAGPPSLTRLEEGDWADAWRAHFQPLPVGRRLLVVPPWEAGAGADGRVVIVIEPARAFGTGHHASTETCLRRLEAVVEALRPAAALDLGTGSGILAIAAARLGVARVLAIDQDPDAVAAAQQNTARNDVADRVQVRLADAATLETTPAPLVLANLLSSAHLALAWQYARLVAPGGRLVVGGLLADEAAGVTATLERHGFVRLATATRDGWAALELTRAPA